MDYKTIYATMQFPPEPLPSASTGVAVAGSESEVSKTMEKSVGKKSIGGCQIKMVLMQRNAIVDELEDVVLSDSVRLSSSFYMCGSQPGSDQHRITGVLECIRTKLNWMTQGARLTRLRR